MTTSLYLLQLSRSALKKKLFIYFFNHPDREHYLREIAIRLNMDPANLSRELQRLEQEGIFRSKKQGNLKYFALNRDYPLYQELHSIVTKTLDAGEKRPEIHKAKVYMIAGPNGAGKTTFARKFLPEYVKCKQFVNADLIAGGLSPFSPETAALTAGKLLIEKVRELSERLTDFGFETTLSGKSYVPFLKNLRMKGYRINLFFLWIPTLELAMARIQDRVKRGGHDIPEPVVKRRFRKGIEHLFKLYRPLLDSWMLFDNSGVSPHLVAMEEKNQLTVVDQSLFDQISKSAEIK